MQLIANSLAWNGAYITQEHKRDFLSFSYIVKLNSIQEPAKLIQNAVVITIVDKSFYDHTDVGNMV